MCVCVVVCVYICVYLHLTVAVAEEMESEVLLEVNSPVLTNTACQEYFAIDPILPSHICSGDVANWIGSCDVSIYYTIHLNFTFCCVLMDICEISFLSLLKPFRLFWRFGAFTAFSNSK